MLNRHAPAACTSAALRTRELERRSEADCESIRCDNGQSIRRSLIAAESPLTLLGAELRGRNQVVCTEIEDERSGMYFRTSPFSSASRPLARPALGYPEILPFLQAAFAACAAPDIDLAKAASHWRSRGKVIEPCRVDARQSAYLACLCPDPFTSPSQSPVRSWEVRVFNPRALALSAKNPAAPPALPGRDGCLFLIDYYLRLGEDRASVALGVHPYSLPRLGSVSELSLRGIERERGAGFYLLVEEEIMGILEAIAPLPLEHSDCGAGLGYPGRNWEYCGGIQEQPDQMVQRPTSTSNVIRLASDV